MNTGQSIFDRIMDKETAKAASGADPQPTTTGEPTLNAAFVAAPASNQSVEPVDGKDNQNLEFINEISGLADNDEGAPAGEKGRSIGGTVLMGIAACGVLFAGVAAGVLVWNGGGGFPWIAEAADKTPSAEGAGDAQGRVGRSAEAPARSATLFDEHVAKAGADACKNIFPLLGSAATSASTYVASSSWNEKEPSAHAIQSLVGMTINTETLKGKGAAVVDGVPVGARCEGRYVRIVPVEQDCGGVQATLPVASRVAADLGGTPLIALPSGSQVMLIPSAGNGCVVVTTMRAAG